MVFAAPITVNGCCCLQALEAAIELGLPRVEAGAQGEHKISRGYSPSTTYSSHYIADPAFRSAVGHFLDRENLDIEYRHADAHCPLT